MPPLALTLLHGGRGHHLLQQGHQLGTELGEDHLCHTVHNTTCAFSEGAERRLAEIHTGNATLHGNDRRGFQAHRGARRSCRARTGRCWRRTPAGPAALTDAANVHMRRTEQGRRVRSELDNSEVPHLFRAQLVFGPLRT